MRPVAVVLLAAMLAGCNAQPEAAEDSPRHGRYVGIGVFSVGELWSKMTAANPQDAAAARIADDEHVIVVVDSVTGELRECGDYSGHCISMNPWTKAISVGQESPVKLAKHMADVMRDAGKSEALATLTPAQRDADGNTKK